MRFRFSDSGFCRICNRSLRFAALLQLSAPAGFTISSPQKKPRQTTGPHSGHGEFVGERLPSSPIAPSKLPLGVAVTVIRWGVGFPEGPGFCFRELRPQNVRVCMRQRRLIANDPSSLCQSDHFSLCGFPYHAQL
jgi:hypothetical protein